MKTKSKFIAVLLAISLALASCEEVVVNPIPPGPPADINLDRVENRDIR
ncbi:MAG: hypothetical protein AB7K37_06455 [Cyclobacteriaceae bacterium]